MQIYMLSFTGVDASSAPVQAGLPHGGSGKSAEIGDLVLGIIAVQKGLTTFTAEVLDESASFASVVTENSGIPGAPVLIQNSQNLNNRVMIALM